MAAAATGEGGGGAGGRLRERGVGERKGLRERGRERAGLGIIKDGWLRVEVGPLVNLPCVARLHTTNYFFAVCSKLDTRQTISL